jgi:hypothetical protein
MRVARFVPLADIERLSVVAALHGNVIESGVTLWE